MSSRQINFFVMPDEWEPLENYLKDNNMISVARKMKTKEIELVDLVNGQLFCYLLDEQHKNTLKTNFVKEANSFFVESSTFSPVIEFGKSYFDKENNFLRANRLYYTTGFWNDKGEWEEKPQEFIKKAEKLFRWFKQTYKNAKLQGFDGYLVSQRTKDKVEKEGLKLKKI